MEKNNKKNKFSLSIIIQMILSVVIICLLLMWLFVSGKFINYLWLVVGLDLIVIGYNNEKYFKRNGVTLYYFVVGIICIGYAILKLVGAF